MGQDTDPHLATVIASLVKHLHAFAKEVQLTQAEWEVGIDFLTRTRPDLQRRTAGVHPAQRRARILDAGRRHRDRPEPGGPYAAGRNGRRAHGSAAWSSASMSEAVKQFSSVCSPAAGASRAPWRR